MSTTQFPSVSIIIPCRNEVHYIEGFINSIAEQTYPKDKCEIIVADGMSNDGTKEKLESLRKKSNNLVIVENKSQTTPHALNLAIEKSTGEIIVRMDCHAIYPENYVESLVTALVSLNADNVGVPLDTIAKDQSAKAIAIALALSSKVGVGGSQFRTSAPDKPLAVDTVPFGCFPRNLFQRIGNFSELLIRNQDDEFNNRIRLNGGKIYLLPSPRVQYFARNNFESLTKMFYQYGLYKPLSNKVSGRLSSLRQLAPIAFQALLLLLIIASVLYSAMWLLTALFIFAYFACIFTFGIGDIKQHKQPLLKTGIYFSWAVLCMHQSYGIGYWQGFFLLLMGKTKFDQSLSR